MGGDFTEEEIRVEHEEREAIRDEGAAPTVDVPLLEHCTDLGNARRFALQHGDRLRFVDALGGWLHYDGTRWRRDDTGEVYRLWESTVRAIYQEAALVGTRKEREQIAAWAAKSENRSRVEAAIALARHQPQIAARAQDFDSTPWLFNVLNGTFELRSGELREHEREDMITKVAPVIYNPTAEAPKWEAMLHRIFDGHEELIAFVRRFVGHALTGLTTEQVLLLLHGVGANGKSTFVEIIRTMLGDYAQTADFGTFLARDTTAVRNDLARLAGARFVSAIEMSAGGRLDESVIKQVTGGDTITARYLFHEHFEYKPEFKLVLVANHRPRIRGTDHAIWRRVQLVPFEVVIPLEERDSQLLDRIVNCELSGVLNWALDGCREWQTQGLGAPEAVTAATDSYRAEQDTLGPFIAECCTLEATATATSKGVYAAYKDWAEKAGEKTLSQRVLAEALRERGFKSRHTKTGTVWDGFRVTGDTW